MNKQGRFSSSWCMHRQCAVAQPNFERGAVGYHEELAVPIFGGEPDLNKPCAQPEPDR
jgi:hypothetical protein